MTDIVAPGPVPVTCPAASTTPTVGWPRSAPPATPEAGGARNAAAVAAEAGGGPSESKPWPNVLFGTGVPSGAARCFSIAASATGLSVGSASSRSAAAPVVNGAAWLVPQNLAATVVSTQSTATRSGLIRPSSVGPRELYGSMTAGVR